MDSGIEAFFRQIPVGLILMFCGSGMLLIGALAYIVWSRRRRNRDSAAPSVEVVMEIKPMDDDLMPDLDALSNPSEKPAAPRGSALPQKFSAPPPPPSLDSAPPAARPGGAYRLMLSSGGTADAVEVFTVLRDVADGSLIVQIGGRAYRHPVSGADADFMHRLNSALRDLTAAPPAVPEAEPDAGEEMFEMPPDFDSPPLDAAPGTIPGDLPRFRMEDQPPLTTRRGRKPPTVEIPSINIGASIEAFLQHKRAVSGDFAGRRIHVRSGLSGAIVIEVDGQFYDGVNDIADLEVRRYLQKTIEEWQSRQ
ncbi:MAG: hypothetical protein L6Q98_01530 [Anaerolineae bacterium]|nr:hypothetical protein [Anaerolineae bacterium]NUQ04451.1 hypothetical protein [Anaerolineae bacterium]